MSGCGVTIKNVVCEWCEGFLRGNYYDVTWLPFPGFSGLRPNEESFPFEPGRATFPSKTLKS